MKGDAAKADILIFIGNPVFTPWRLILQMPRAPCPPHEKDTPLVEALRRRSRIAGDFFYGLRTVSYYTL
jgi:hypothetical protein